VPDPNIVSAYSHTWLRAIVGMLVTALMAASIHATAFARAGSTGGTLGNTDKSISGERREEPSPRQKPREPKPHAAPKTDAPNKRASSSCGKIAGSWKWGGVMIAIKIDGTAQHAIGGGGTWTCNDRQYVFSWSNGITDHVTLSADGNSLSGSNNLGWTFSGARL
jgi:hypothetical protein